ncbi:MAG: hypothetical protein WCF84_06935 [Anaerolineae bacterium]
MSRNTKIILTITGAVLVLCALSCVLIVLLLPNVFKNAVATTPGKAQDLGKQIADYTVPEGYTETGMDMLVYKLVMLTPKNRTGPQIMLFQMNTMGTSRAQMEQQMRQSFERSFSQQSGGTYHSAGEHAVTIKGQANTLTVSETDSSTSSRYTMREAIGVFDGKGGTAMVMAIGDVSEWDWQVVDSFCASIR